MITTGYVIRTEAGDFRYYGDEESAQRQHRDLYWDSVYPTGEDGWDKPVTNGYAQSTKPISIHPILEADR